MPGWSVGWLVGFVSWLITYLLAYLLACFASLEIQAREWRARNRLDTILYRCFPVCVGFCWQILPSLVVVIMRFAYYSY
ncbi:hypothetical protein BDW42DRAFT_55450 [Aspergillus taichungensis]|uniref:Uncharacterized protein n=1 Tax=Aspergillus taichungensis TaxID=482145 RepID=A0A2J5I9C7_9EURO|nr:hypothetical protein BDW42DRAFT_55450 [Aspergillus taichungensis]